MIDIPRSYYKPTETQRAELNAYRDRLFRLRQQRASRELFDRLADRARESLFGFLDDVHAKAQKGRFEE